MISCDQIKKNQSRRKWSSEPIKASEYTCQKSDTSVADAVNLWLNLELPAAYKENLKNRQEMAMNVYALCTYYLHPTYDKSKLTADHKGKINAFLLKNLNSQGIEEWDNFMTKSGMSNLFIFRFEITIFVLQEYLLPS
jgi:hypothetical protein